MHAFDRGVVCPHCFLTTHAVWEGPGRLLCAACRGKLEPMPQADMTAYYNHNSEHLQSWLRCILVEHPHWEFFHNPETFTLGFFSHIHRHKLRTSYRYDPVSITYMRGTNWLQRTVENLARELHDAEVTYQRIGHIGDVHDGED